jgi:hypothetical protein
MRAMLSISIIISAMAVIGFDNLKEGLYFLNVEAHHFCRFQEKEPRG